MLCPGTLVASITAAAVALSEGREPDETSLLGAAFTQLGDTLATIAEQQNLIMQKRNKECSNAAKPSLPQSGNSNPEPVPTEPEHDPLLVPDAESESPDLDLNVDYTVSQS